MPSIIAINPLDQPLGVKRLLEDLKIFLQDDKFDAFGMSVAFAKTGPLFRLAPYLDVWKENKKTISAIFGYDHKGTSLQALRFALDNFNSVYVTQYPGHSFHPKIYWFYGKEKAILYIGSNNLTVGGTELNFEAGVQISFILPDEEKEFNDFMVGYNQLLPNNCSATKILDEELFAKLISDDLLLDEAVNNRERKNDEILKKKKRNFDEIPKMPFRPASSIPAKTFGSVKKTKIVKEKAKAIKIQADNVDLTKPLVPVSGLAMQIKPHHNGEIFLSRTAATQNPAFFGMPFTGITKPKKGENDGYPQRDPDPISNIIVYGAENKILLNIPKYKLNTVFYTTKAEIRVTASPLIEHVPEYSVMIMSISEQVDSDYDIAIFTPDSPDYEKWVTVCNQTMPSGGKVARKFGWF